MNTSPERGVQILTVVTAACNNGSPTSYAYRWRCGRCQRMGRVQDQEKATAGAERHRGYHAAMDRLEQPASV